MPSRAAPTRRATWTVTALVWLGLCAWLRLGGEAAVIGAAFALLVARVPERPDLYALATPRHRIRLPDQDRRQRP
jgi:hypothetical protein